MYTGSPKFIISFLLHKQKRSKLHTAPATQTRVMQRNIEVNFRKPELAISCYSSLMRCSIIATFSTNSSISDAVRTGLMLVRVSSFTEPRALLISLELPAFGEMEREACSSACFDRFRAWQCGQ